MGVRLRSMPGGFHDGWTCGESGCDWRWNQGHAPSLWCVENVVGKPFEATPDYPPTREALESSSRYPRAALASRNWRAGSLPGMAKGGWGARFRELMASPEWREEV